MHGGAEQGAQLVTAIDGLAQQIEERLEGAIADLTKEVTKNREILRRINDGVGSLDTAIRLTIDRLPGPAAHPPRTELTELALLIQSARTHEATLIAYFSGSVEPPAGEIARRINDLSSIYHAIVSDALIRRERLRDTAPQQERQHGRG